MSMHSARNVFSGLLIAMLLLLAPLVATGQPNDARAQQRMQQEQMRRQQEDMRRQQVEVQRRQLQDQMRAQVQDQARRQMREQQQGIARQQIYDQQQRLREDAARTQKERASAQGSTDAQRREDLRQQGRLGVARPGDQAVRGPFRASNGIAQAPRQPTPAEAKRGFTGKVTPDGKALVRFQGRVVTVPASRIGVMPRPTATSQAALATGWSQQKQANINADIRKLAGGGGGGGGSSGGGGTGAGKPGITGTFNTAANQTGISPSFNAAAKDRIALANTARGLTVEQKYAKSAHDISIDESHVAELKAKGVKFSRESLIATGLDKQGSVVFLEKGNDKAGLSHIIKEHGSQFAAQGIQEYKIPEVLMKALAEGEIVGVQGKSGGRPIYETVIDGKLLRVAITTASNGFIVGANPSSGGALK